MTDASTSNFPPPLQCSLCGTTVDLDAARFECVTKTTWRSKTTWWKDQDAKSFAEYSDPRDWLVALCRACRVKSYLRSLKKQAKYSLICIFLCILFIILGAYTFWWDFLYLHSHGMIAGRTKGDLELIIAGLACVIGLPLCIWWYFATKARLALSGDLQEISLKHRAETFKDAGETILERLETLQGGPVYGDFPLPVLPEDPVPRDIPEKFKLADDKPEQERLVRKIKET